MKVAVRALTALVALVLPACGSCGSEDTVAEKDGGVRAEGGAPQPGLAATATRDRDWTIVDELHQCEVRHRGVSIDVGSRSALSRRSFSVGPFDDVEDAVHEGATVSHVLTKRLTYEVWLDAPLDGLFVQLRALGGVSRRVSIYLDDDHLASPRLAEDEMRIVETPPLERVVEPGRHTLLLRFQGKATSRESRYATLDWIRIGVPDELTATYSAPTLEDVVTDQALDGKPRRSVALRAPGSIRCPLRVTPGARLRADLGFWGEGRGTADVRVLRDGEEPVVLQERRVSGGEGAIWSPLDIPLDSFDGQLVALELRATQATRGGRILFGGARVTQAEPVDADAAPPTRTVVVVVLAGLDRRLVPPWGPIQTLAAFGELARSGAAFGAYRVPTTVPAAVMASLLTGLGPRQHWLEDPSARLPASIQSIAEIVKQAGGRTAMFTSVPNTFRAFGFERGWDRYESYSPVADIGADEPFLQASEWIEEGIQGEPAPAFVLIHARGAHPPWDLPRETAAELGPPEYSGPIDARRGAVTLAKIRSRSRAHRRLDEQDWKRVQALATAALEKQNAALGNLIATMKRAGLWEDAVFVMTSDVAPGDPPTVPWDPAGSLGEERLIVPLVVKFPGDRFATKEVGVPATTVDLPVTVLRALRLDVPEGLDGVDLFRTASGSRPVSGRALVATLGNSFSTRWGRWLLSGDFDRRPKLCELSVDPACVTDVLDQHPIAARALWQHTFDAEHEARLTAGKTSRREPATIDPDTQSALVVWGE